MNGTNIENVKADIITAQILQKICTERNGKLKDSIMRSILKTVKSVINSKHNAIYKEILFFPFKYPDELDEFILRIGKIDGIIFHQEYFIKTVLGKKRKSYSVTKLTTKYLYVLDQSPYLHWAKRLCEIGYNIAMRTAKGFKLPEFKSNEKYYFSLSRSRIKKRTKYVIIETTYKRDTIFATPDDYVIAPKSIIDNVLERFKRAPVDIILRELKKESLLCEI